MTPASSVTERRDRFRAQSTQGPIIAGIGPAGGDGVLRLTQALAARQSTDALVVSVVDEWWLPRDRECHASCRVP